MTRLFQRLAAVVLGATVLVGGALVGLPPAPAQAASLIAIGPPCPRPSDPCGTVPWEIIGDEISRTVYVTVSLSAPASVDVSVLLSTEDGSAVAPGDYRAVTDRWVTVPAGMQTETILLEIRPDNLTEGDESFYVTISSATQGTIVGDLAEVIILDTTG